MTGQRGPPLNPYDADAVVAIQPASGNHPVSICAKIPLSLLIESTRVRVLCTSTRVEERVLKEYCSYLRQKTKNIEPEDSIHSRTQYVLELYLYGTRTVQYAPLSTS
jgi:hypothetical protein